ncbi:MAG: NAD-dependent epimerase/dehydratase family protein [Candidatus Binatia bacterium]
MRTGMKVVVTGGSGRLGHYVVRELLDHGYEVLSLDRIPPTEKLCPSWVADLRKSGDLYEALKGSQGVVHLGAYQAPNLASDSETFSNNVTATYNVLKAVSDMGVKRVVIASSVAAYGFLYALRAWIPDYLPLDESHPCRPQDPYGLSKLVGERIAESFVTRGDIKVASLRLTGINFDRSYKSFTEQWKNPRVKLGTFWTYVDARDAALACRLGLESDISGHEVFNIAAPTSRMRESTDDLIRRFLPGIKTIKEGLTGNWSGLDSSKAETFLGYRAQHVWENYLNISDSVSELTA